MTVLIAGRSSSHFTRVVRVFAHELGVEYHFRPVLDLMSQERAEYLGNPALKIPVLATENGSWFGALSICRELARRARQPNAIVWPEHLTELHAANAQELVLQGMATEVSMIMRKSASGAPPSDAYAEKCDRSLIDSLVWLEANLPHALQRLRADRTLSFLEVTAFCFVTHLEFRQVTDTTPYAALRAFCRTFSERPSARATGYAFDAA